MSEIRVNQISDTSGSNARTPAQIEQGRAKVWVYFRNLGGTPSIQADHNVNTIGDNGTGRYTVNFSSALSGSNYCVIVDCADATTSDQHPFIGNSSRALSRSSTSCTFSTTNFAINFQDKDENFFAAWD